MPPHVHCELAPAKLNLALAVGPREEDGLHPICSWMVTVDLCDELLVTRLPEDRLSRYAVLWHPEARRTSEIDWSIRRDLAVRAHLALERHLGRALPVQLKLEKRIPVGGGLGGGSSAAAAMLRAVSALFDLGLTADELAAIGATVGSDVPFLVHGGSAIVEGRGERIERHERGPELSVVLVFPAARCSTAAVYGRFDELPPAPLRADAVRALAAGSPRVPSDALFNDLAEPALHVAPELADLLARLAENAGRPAHVSGSGSTAFIVCDDPLHAEHLAVALEEQTGVPAVAAAFAGPASPAPQRGAITGNLHRRSCEADSHL